MLDGIEADLVIALARMFGTRDGLIVAWDKGKTNQIQEKVVLLLGSCRGWQRIRGSRCLLERLKPKKTLAIEERKGSDVAIVTRKRRSSGMHCSQRLRHYASEILTAMSM